VGTDQQAAGRGSGSGGGTTGLTIASVAVLTIVALAVILFVIFHDRDPSDQKIADGVKLTKAEAHGQALFGETCASCHTLAASHSAGTVGPNLDQLRPNRALVLTAINDGFTTPVGVMPAGLYSGSDAADVAAYVARAAGVGVTRPRPSTSGAATGAPDPSTSAAPPTSTSATPPAGGGGGAAGGGDAAALAAGRTVFTMNCASCHTLRDAGSTGTIGPNLDQLAPDLPTVQRQVINGGGGMPAFGGTLSRTDIDNVSRYVSAVAGR
jgi:mono/diheme cytochrome c family protein